MPPTNYQRGRAFEYRTRNKLLKLGAGYVMRAAQSKGKADLIALWPSFDWAKLRTPEPVWLVQCKYSIHGGGTLSPADRTELIDLARLVGAKPVFARPGKNGRGVLFTDLLTQGDPTASG